MIVQRDGFWWPETDVHARPVLTRQVGPAVEEVLRHVRGRTCIVQAGGNVGVYPLALADHFRRVITFEPDPVNVRCLWLNLAARDTFKRVDGRNAALGEDYGTCAVEEAEPGNCGAHRIRPDEGQIVMLPLDGLDLIACDAIWLDVEGYELRALRGAQETLERFSPAVIVEDKGHGQAFGEAPGELGSWLQAKGYAEVSRIGRDRIFTRTNP
jgi:FkbM family methyltransferase